jgi:peptidoglycan/xylan/chitin deacetylase (PgdA/CDA1 family)
MPIVIAGVLIVVLASYWFVLRRSIFILAYHGIGLESSPIEGLVIRPDSFRSQMRLLSALGFRNIALDEAVDRIRRGDPPKTPILCITFDDGYHNIRAHALPILLEMGWTATVFVPTELVGTSNDWDASAPIPPIPLLNWSDLEFLTSKGILIGSHGKTHRSLLRLAEDECLTELRDSLSALRSRLPHCSLVFSYPFGHRNPATASLAQRSGYAAACSMVAGAVVEKDDLFDLGRLPVGNNNLLAFLLALAWYPVTSFGRFLLRRM